MCRKLRASHGYAAGVWSSFSLMIHGMHVSRSTAARYPLSDLCARVSLSVSCLKRHGDDRYWNSLGFAESANQNVSHLLNST